MFEASCPCRRRLFVRNQVPRAIPLLCCLIYLGPDSGRVWLCQITRSATHEVACPNGSLLRQAGFLNGAHHFRVSAFGCRSPLSGTADATEAMQENPVP